MGVQATRNVSVIAGEDLTGDLYKFCVIDNTGRIVVNTTAQGIVDGIVAEEVSAAGRVTSMIIPDGAIAEVLAGGTITPGQIVASDNQGRAIARGASNGDIGVGRYMGTANAASGDVIEIQFCHKGQVNA